jgi:hypothetical protein
MNLLILVMFTHNLWADEKYTYIESTGEKECTFHWKLFFRGNMVEIVSSQEQEEFYCLCTPDGLTEKWTHTQQNQAITVRREKNMLILSGRKDGRDFAKNIEIDQAPWFQTLSYSLRQFNASPQNMIEFWHVRQDTLEPVKLSARKMDSGEEIQCNGQPAEQIEIRPSGLLSQIWHARYLFRKQDKVFCRYEGRHGWWGTPLTVISLLQDQ